MTYLKSYKRLSRLIEDESFEPLISWGGRMALSGTLPVVWGLATGNVTDAVWITLTAEAVSWVELKGSFTWRVRTLLAGAVLAVLFSILGTATESNIWLSMIAMFIVGYIGTLLKNMGDRASGLAICVYMLFIICNAYPAREFVAINHRVALVAIGAAWPVVVGIFISLLMPAKEPFRRQIALIWRAISELIVTISKNGNDKNAHDTNGGLYAKEREVRTAINNSYQFYEQMVHEVNKKDNQQYQLALLRKIAGIVAANVIAMGEEMEHIDIPELDEALRIKAAALFSAMKEAVTRISVFVISLKPEEKLLAISHINRLKKLTALTGQYPLPADDNQATAIKRILQLTGRTVKLLESAIQRVEHMGNDVPVYKSYSFLKTLFVLKPRYLFSSLRVLFSVNSFTARYALRSAIAATIALFVYKWFHISHGYWLPFSVMIIIQPYFGATFKKGMDRIVGTLLGGLAGSLLLHIPVGLHIKESVLFLTFILMVYYMRKQYAVAVFMITLNLVLLFNIEKAYNDMLMVTRAACTIGGALLAVLSGFALLPAWDKKWLPSHLADAICSNYEYFITSFYSATPLTAWTKPKRIAESKNSNVFDSFNRYIDEPGKEKSMIYYDLITCNVRITRDLNNLHIEQDEKKTTQPIFATPLQQKRINECLDLFNVIMSHLRELNPVIKLNIYNNTENVSSPLLLNEAQIISLEKLIIELKGMQDDMAKMLNFS